jgi:hypothetical protein
MGDGGLWTVLGCAWGRLGGVAWGVNALWQEMVLVRAAGRLCTPLRAACSAPAGAAGAEYPTSRADRMGRGPFPSMLLDSPIASLHKLPSPRLHSPLMKLSKWQKFRPARAF